MFYRILICQTVLVVFTLAPPARANLTFTVDFTQQAQNDLSADEQALFTGAVGFWDALIIEHRDGVARNWTLEVDTFAQPASGGGVLLGFAGPAGLAFSEVVPDANTSNGRFIISTAGAASFNVHPDAGPLSSETITHEIAHALGFGTLWEDNEVYNDGISGNSNRTLAGGVPGEYVGEAALAAYQAEFVDQQEAAFVPVELAGGTGTAHSHWDESDNFGQSPTGIVDFLGRDLQLELMTGWAAPGEEFVSNTTAQSFFDIGFTVVPEPSTIYGLLLGFVWLVSRRRSHRRIFRVATV